jgi:hypothetical protein
MTDEALWKRAFSTLGTLRTGIEQRDGMNLQKARIREIESVLHELKHRGAQFVLKIDDGEALLNAFSAGLGFAQQEKEG